MSEPYPLPSYAVSVWFNGEALMVALPPGTDSDSRTHTIALPLDKCGIVTSLWGGAVSANRGWAALLDILKARHHAGRSVKIAERGAPTAYDIEGMLKAYSGNVNRVTPTSLADLDLDDEH